MLKSCCVQGLLSKMSIRRGYVKRHHMFKCNIILENLAFGEKL